MTDLVNVTIKPKAWSDIRFAVLARALELADAHHALIRCARLWSWQAANFKPERPTYEVSEDVIEAVLGKPGAAHAMVRAQLAEPTAAGFYIKGTRDKGAITWYANRLRTAPLGGERRKRQLEHIGHPDGSHGGYPPSFRNEDNTDHPSGSHHGSPDGSQHGSEDGYPLRSDPSSVSLDLDLEPSASNSHVRDSDESPDSALGKLKAKTDKNSKAAAAERAARVPDRAWKAADKLRELVLADDPAAVIGLKPWGDDVRDGARLEWADGIRLLVERDRRSYEDVWTVMRWLFETDNTFVVQSPDALRKKWDAIQANRRRGPPQARGAPIGSARPRNDHPESPALVSMKDL